MLNLEKLILRDGVILLRSGGDPKYFNRMLDRTEVMIVEKLNFVRSSDSEFCFKFVLSEYTDPEWRELFFQRCQRLCVDFSGKEVRIVCPPAELGAILSDVKAALGPTNVAYAALREDVVKQITERIEEFPTPTLTVELPQPVFYSDGDARNAMASLEVSP